MTRILCNWYVILITETSVGYILWLTFDGSSGLRNIATVVRIYAHIETKNIILFMESKAYMQWIPQSPPQSFDSIWTPMYQLWLLCYRKQYGEIRVPTHGVSTNLRCYVAAYGVMYQLTVLCTNSRCYVPGPSYDSLGPSHRRSEIFQKCSRGKVKIKVTLEQATKSQKGSRVITLLFL